MSISKVVNRNLEVHARGGDGRAPEAMDDNMNRGGWDEHYRGHDHQGSSGKPNGVLLAEVAGLAPGRALDVGCGSGADAIWLARQGWQVTAVDVSQAALDRAAIAAHDAEVAVNWVCTDISTIPPAVGDYGPRLRPVPRPPA